MHAMALSCFRVILFLTLFTFLFSVGSASAREKAIAGKQAGKPSTNLLTGVWESADTTAGGLGIIYEFREDGGLMAGMGALVNLAYDPQDPSLKQLLPESQATGNGDRPQKIMDGPAGSPPYTGVWKFRHYTGGYAYQQITADGRIMLRVPFPIPWARYEVKGNKLLIFQKGCPRKEVIFKVTEKSLDLTKPGNKETVRLMRVIPAWYHALTESEVEEAKIRLQKSMEEKKASQREPQFDFKVIQ